MSESIGTRIWIEVETAQEGELLWSAFCTTLSLAGHGNTEHKAMVSLLRAVQAYVDLLKKRGVMEEVLDRKGIEYESIEQPSSPYKIPIDIF